MTALLNRAYVTTATVGQGTIAIGSAVEGYASFSEAGAQDATAYPYCIEDGNNFEIGVGTYSTAGPTLSRDTVTLSKISGVAGTTKLSLSGSARVFITPGAAQLLITDAIGTTIQAYDADLATWAGVTPAAGIATFLATPSSANLASAVTDETGSGALVFATSPTLVTPALGTPASGTLTNCTGLPLSGVVDSTSEALGVGSLELGHATDTTLTRVSAGVVAIEGVNIVTTSATQTLTNKTLTSPTITTPTLTVLDTGFTLQEDSDNTKRVVFQLSAITTGTTRTLALPNGNGTLILNSGAQTLSDKTIVSPIITTAPTAAGATWTDLGAATTIDINGGTIDGASIGASSPSTIVGTTIQANTGFVPDANDGAYLGQAGTAFSDLFLASGAVIDLNAGDITLTHSANTLTLAGGTLVLPASGLQVGSSNPFSDSAGTLTLQNVDAIDATTESTIEAAIDTLANLTSIQGRTVTLADAGADAILGWDDSASAYENLTSAEATAILDVAVGDSGAGGTKGLVPAPAAGDATKFLRGDATWVTIPGGGDALTTNPLSQFASTTSAQLAGVISDETGSGALVFATSPTFTGTPTAPTAAANTNTTQIATTAFVQGELAEISSPQIGFWEDVGLGANIYRVGDRLLVGDAVDHDGNYTPTSGVGTWLRLDVNGGLTYAEKTAQLASFQYEGGIAGSFASRMSDNGGLSTDGVPIGLWSFVYNDSSGSRSVWGIYNEARRITAAGRAIGIEVDVANEGNELSDVNSYDVSDTTTAFGAWLASGGDPSNTNSNTVYDGTLALGIVNNGARWRKGILFANNSLYGADGLIRTGTAQAGGASTITLAAGESSTDDYFNGYAVVIDGGTGSGQQRMISDYVGSTKVATVSTAWTTPPDATSTYSIRGRGRLMEAPIGHEIVFKYSGGVNARGGTIRSDCNNANTQQRIVFRDGAFDVSGVASDLTSETVLFRVVSLLDATNYVTASPAASGNTPSLKAASTVNANVDLLLGGQGTGVVRSEDALVPNSSDGASLGNSSLQWSDIFLASGAAANFANGDTILTHSAGVITLNPGDLRVTSPGSHAASVLTRSSGWYVVAASAVAVTRNSVNGAGDATETVQVTVTIPAGTIGPNGVIRLTWLGSCTNSANVKTWRVRFGASGAGTGGTAYYNVAATSSATLHNCILIRNRNSNSSQVGATNATSTSFNQSTGSTVTSSIDTASATEIVISNLWAGATSGESMTVESYLVEVFYKG